MGCTLVTFVGNDAPFLLEWVAYHRLIGFDRIIAFSQACDDGSDAMLDLLAEAGLVEHRRNDDGAPEEAETRACARALPLLARDEWAMPLPPREFLAIHAGEGRLEDLIAALPRNTGAVALRSCLFGSAPDRSDPGASPLQILRHNRLPPEDARLPARARALRMLFRPAVAARLGPRRPWFGQNLLGNRRIRDGNGTDVTDMLRSDGWKLPHAPRGFSLAQINDYSLGSRGGRLVEMGGDAAAMLESADRLDRATNPDDSLQHRAGEVAAAVEAMTRAQPRLAAIEAEACDARAAAIADARAALEASDPALAARVFTLEAPPPRPPAPAWLAELATANPQGPVVGGSYRTLGHHALIHVGRGQRMLLVGFDNFDAPRGGPIRDGWGADLAARRGWSYLGVLAMKPSWFRDPALIEALRALRERGFFARFAEVALIGAGMGGFGACAFAPLAPGCRVVALAPQATLDPDLAPWDDRFPAAQGADWSLGFAAADEGAASASEVHLVHDPRDALDRRHAAAFTAASLHHHPLPFAGGGAERLLRQPELLWQIVEAGARGELTRAGFATMRRRQRLSRAWLDAAIPHLLAGGHQRLAAAVLDHIEAAGRARLARTWRSQIPAECAPAHHLVDKTPPAATSG